MVTVALLGGSTPMDRHHAMSLCTCWKARSSCTLGVGEKTTPTPGQTFYGDPEDIHVVSRNASVTERAKFGQLHQSVRVHR